jgi:5-methyltetrahydropteroyltriglutamate--homocysteine methyltransferase
MTDPFPTFVVGSLPRPEWVRDIIEDRKAGRLDPLEADRLLDSAVPFAVRLQERAGVDYVSDGEWRRESYVKIFADRIGGFEPDVIRIEGSPLTYPAVTSPLGGWRPIAVDEVRFLKALTRRKVIVAIPSPYTIGRRMWHPERSRRAYPTRRDFIAACVPIIRQELQALAQLGVDAVQLDDPWLALLVDPDYRRREGIGDVEAEVASCVHAVNEASEGISGLFLSLHVCRAHFNRRRLTRGSYDIIMDGLARMRVHRLAMEFAAPEAGGLEVLKRFPTDKLLGLGVIDHCARQVETPAQVVERVERALEYVPEERMTLNPDCGFAPSSANPMDLDEAYRNLAAMARGAALLRDRYA